ncbi:MAG: sulfatase-like hydrolase/transferase, partial [Bacteroidota bacterium]
KAEYPAPYDSVYDGAWGIPDEPFFLHALGKINEFREPFCSVIFSLSSHDPYTIPAFRKKLFEEYKGETDFQKSLRYADFSLRQFFEQAKNTPWFKNTVVLITADHTSFTAENNLYEIFHIPLLIVAPSILTPGVRDDGGSHVDILPTILDLLQIEAVHSSMGFSLLDRTRTRYAIVRWGGPYGIFSASHLYLNDPESSESLYAYPTDPFCKNNLKDVLPAIKEDLKRKLLSYVQAATKAINSDLVYRK